MLRGIAADPAARALNDDCAVLEIGGKTLVLTHDMMAQGTHFLPDADPADLAWKLVAANVSDLAAKGARPVGALLGYMLGPDDARFLEGLTEALSHYGMPLLGGDTISGNGPQVVGLTAIGEATALPVPSRSGARAGDELWITGPVGAAMMGLEALQADCGDSLAYRRPQARLAEGIVLAPLVTAMMDVSDGLLLDGRRMAEASGVTLTLDTHAVPLAAPENRRDDALRWGDDYELLFTTPPGTKPPVPACCIGVAISPAGVPLLIDGSGPAPDDRLGFEHS